MQSHYPLFLYFISILTNSPASGDLVDLWIVFNFPLYDTFRHKDVNIHSLAQ